MDALVEAYEKNRSEIVPTLVSGFFVIFFLYFFYKELNISPLQSISIFERMLAVFIVSYVLGKIFFILGLSTFRLLSFAIFQDDPRKHLKSFYEDLCISHTSGARVVSDDVDITNMEIFEYLGNNSIANLEFQKNQTNKYFWVTFLGASIIFGCFAWSFHMSLFVPSIVIAMSLIASSLNKKASSRLWHDLAVMIQRKHSGSETQLQGSK